MKKVVFSVCALTVMAAGIGYAASVNGDYKGYGIVNVVVNGKKVQGEVPGINMDGTTLVPLRLVSESLGATVEWDGATSTATIAMAAPALPKPETPEQALNRELFGIYEELRQHVEYLAEIREKIRIGKEYYDIRKSGEYLQRLGELVKITGYQRFQDTTLKISGLTEQANKQKVNLIDLLKLTGDCKDTLQQYETAIEHLNRHIAGGQTSPLDFYIQAYSAAFDRETELKRKIEEGLRTYRQGGAEAK